MIASVASPASLARGVRRYLSSRFPLSQAGAVLSGFVCTYLLYSKAAGDHPFAAVTVLGGIAFVLLFLVRRITDDIEDLREDLASRGLSIREGAGRRQLEALVAGWLAAVALAAALSASGGAGLVVAAVAIPAWFPVATVIKRSVTTRIFFRYVVNETCPPLMLTYGYLVWHAAGGKRLPATTVVSVVALLWLSYQVWNFTRGIVASGEFPPWGMRLRSTEWALLAFLTLSAGAAVAVTATVDLSPVFLVYALALPIVFAVLVVGWWRSLPPDVDVEALPRSRKPRWAGLWYPAALELGVVIGVATSAIGG